MDVQDVACPAADVALGPVVPAGATTAVQHRVLHLQPLALGGFTGVVDTAGRETRSGDVNLLAGCFNPFHGSSV